MDINEKKTEGEEIDILKNETFLLDEVLSKEKDGFKHTDLEEELTIQDPVNQVKFPEALLDEVVKTTKIDYPDPE